MKVLLVSQSEISELLRMPDCIDLMEDALKALGSGDASMPLRQVVWLPDRRGVLAVMPSLFGERGAMGVKVISVFPGNQGTPFDAHQGAVLLFESDHGQLLAIMDASEITAIRTAAVSGVATRLLGRKNSARLALLGSGVQARTHLEAMIAVREIKQANVWSRNFENAQKFASREIARHQIPVVAMKSAREAVQNADIICTTTSSTDPVLEGAWLSPGVHINAAGAYGPNARELDSQAVARSQLYVDRRESTLNESGDYLIPLQQGVIAADHIRGELGEVLLNKVSGRQDDAEITLFKAMGLAIEDLAAAHFIYKKAKESGRGQLIDFGGERRD
jgi:ornithine cyclodeaminase